MKANPGGIIDGDAIIGRENEIDEIWDTLEKRSVILTAERRVGKTCVLRKMSEHPRNGWIPLFCWVEQCAHPIECVEKIYEEALQMEVQSTKGVWLERIRSGYKTLAGTEIAGWQLPQIKSDWKRLLANLVEDVAENTGNRILVILDEFPLMVSKISNMPDGGPELAMDFLDTLRALRQKYQPTDRIRFVLSGSIGLHLVLETLRRNHDYKSNPISDMETIVLSGMCEADVQLMSCKYLDEEGINRKSPDEFDLRMSERTDGLPLYIQHVCERFQDAKRTEVTPEDIDRAVRELFDSRLVEGFAYAAKRIESYYAKLGMDRMAALILKRLSHETDFIPEKRIIDYLRSQMKVEHDDIVLSALELLWDDNYVVRDTSTGGRRYRFRYHIMRRWWEINRG